MTPDCPASSGTSCRPKNPESYRLRGRLRPWWGPIYRCHEHCQHKMLCLQPLSFYRAASGSDQVFSSIPTENSHRFQRPCGWTPLGKRADFPGQPAETRWHPVPHILWSVVQKNLPSPAFASGLPGSGLGRGLVASPAARLARPRVLLETPGFPQLLPVADRKTNNFPDNRL